MNDPDFFSPAPGTAWLIASDDVGRGLQRLDALASVLKTKCPSRKNSPVRPVRYR